MLCSVQACAVSTAKQVHTSPMPELWNMTKCICMASALAIVGIAASVLMLVRNFLHPPFTAPCLLCQL